MYRRRGETYRSEFPVEYRCSSANSDVLIRGRADGYDPQHAVVEEIKTCRIAVADIPEPISRMHMAQARIYGAMICRQENVPILEVRLTWLNIDTDEEATLSQTYSKEELLDFLHDTLDRFSVWLQALTDIRERRNISLARMNFPYPDFRDGQRTIAELVYKCIDQSGQLLLEAPTGIGKTAAVLYPALKALATNKHDRIVFTTAKSVGRLAAEQAMENIARVGFTGPALSMTAKEKICLSPGRACHADDCVYARGYYDKLPEALHAAILGNSLKQEDLENLARRFEVCPYQLSLDLLPWLDIVIADIHYVYSLSATLTHLMQLNEQRWTVLVDEAHNLPGRARQMYGAQLYKADLMAARDALSKVERKTLDAVNRQLLVLQKELWQEAQFDAREVIPEALLNALVRFTTQIGEFLQQEPFFGQRLPQVMEFYFSVLQFLRVAEHWGDDYRFELHRGSSRQSLRVELNCLDPARLLALKHAAQHSVTVFSATLSPLHWSSASLGLGAELVSSRQASPFAAEQMTVFVATHIDTRYRQRAASLAELGTVILRWLRCEPGNCIVYFPSYQYLQDCLRIIGHGDLEAVLRSVWVQEKHQGEGERQELLGLLREKRNMVAFCILGGVFGEGIDLPGEQLASAVIVGVGMPQVNRDTQQLRAWYEEQYGAGFEYAYLYPGMQKVVQALGRVIRQLDDKGKALLIDGRYNQRAYRDLLPHWWNYKAWAEFIG